MSTSVRTPSAYKVGPHRRKLLQWPPGTWNNRWPWWHRWPPKRCPMGGDEPPWAFGVFEISHTKLISIKNIRQFQMDRGEKKTVCPMGIPNTMVLLLIYPSFWIFQMKEIPNGDFLNRQMQSCKQHLTAVLILPGCLPMMIAIPGNQTLDRKIPDL